MEWQRQNKASVHRTAKEFANDHKSVHEWCQCYSTLKGQTRGVLGKRPRLCCGQPLSVDLDHEFLEDERSKGRSVSNQLLSVCNNYMFLCQPLGVAPEEGAFSQDKISDPAYKPPTLSTSAKVAKQGAYMQDAMVHKIFQK